MPLRRLQQAPMHPCAYTISMHTASLDCRSRHQPRTQQQLANCSHRGCRLIQQMRLQCLASATTGSTPGCHAPDAAREAPARRPSSYFPGCCSSSCCMLCKAACAAAVSTLRTSPRSHCWCCLHLTSNLLLQLIHIPAGNT